MDNFQNNLFLNIEFTITEAINEFSKIVAKEYDLDPNVLKEISHSIIPIIFIITIKQVHWTNLLI